MSSHYCPELDQLLGYARGVIDDNQADEISVHLADCASCVARVDTLRSNDDTLRDQFRAFTELDSRIQEPECQAALRALELWLLDGKVLAPSSVNSYDLGTSFQDAARSVVRKGSSLITVAFTDQDCRNQDRASTLPADAAFQRSRPETREPHDRQREPPDRSHQQGLRFGEYVVIESIAEGGMGRVYKARHRVMDRIVALKTIADSRPTDSAAIRYFEREIRLAGRLVHPNVVRSYDAGIDAGVFYLVMEYVPGRTLAELLKLRGRLEVPEACDYVRQAAQGLAAAHEARIVHRDVKPGNLILGDDGVVKVLDMGVACVRVSTLSENAYDGEQTLQGTFLGTADYMAPEQARDPREANDKSDVYALGCTLYRLLTGEPVFPGKTVNDRIAAHRDQPASSPRRLRNDVPLALEELLGRMLAKRPVDRPTMAEVAEFLAHPADNPGPIEQRPAEPPSTSADKGPPRRGRRRTMIAAAGASAFLLFCGIWVYVKDRHGHTIATVQVPDGGKAELSADSAQPSKIIESTKPVIDPTVACELLAAKRLPQGLAAGVIPIDGPRGDGRQGGRGILIAAPKGWQRVGTEWSFRYRRGAAAEGLLIIHPFRDGHVRIVVKPTSLTICRGGPWGSTDVQAYGESAGEPIKIQNDVATSWPLKDDREYAIVSRCDAKGRYSLQVDGLEVGAATIEHVQPQEMKPPFEDKNCPQTLAVGQAALIMGPIDRGVHEAAETRFELIGSPKALQSKH